MTSILIGTVLYVLALTKYAHDNKPSTRKMFWVWVMTALILIATMTVFEQVASIGGGE